VSRISSIQSTTSTYVYNQKWAKLSHKNSSDPCQRSEINSRAPSNPRRPRRGGVWRPRTANRVPVHWSRRLHCTEVVTAVSQKIPLGPGSTPSYVCRPPTWGSVGGDCLILRFLSDWYGPQEMYWTTMEKVIKRNPIIQALLLTALFVGGAIWRQKQPHTSIVSAWLQLNSDFVPKVKIFMEPSDYDVVVCHRYGSGRGGHNRSKSGSNVRVAL
jgi:hypothetical protein